MESSGSKVGYTSPIWTNRLIFGKWTFFTWFFLDIDMNCKGLQTNMPQLVGSKEDLISKNIPTSLHPTFCGIFVCGPLQFMPIYFIFWGRKSILYIWYAVHFAWFVHACWFCPSYIFFARHQRDTLTLTLLETRDIAWFCGCERVIFSRASPFVTPFWRATIMAKQLSTATLGSLGIVQYDQLCRFQCLLSGDASQSHNFITSLLYKGSTVGSSTVP